MARPHLVTLPYEVRDKIFQEYFRVEGGYVFNSESEKLTTTDGEPIDLSLMYTCRSIATDTKHLPFAINNISFSTLLSPELRAWAGRHQFLSHFLCILKADLIYNLQGTHMSPELEAALEEKFPQLMPTLKDRLEWQYRPRGDTCFWTSDPSRLSGYAFKYWEFFDDSSQIIDDRGDEQIRSWGENVSMTREAIAFSLRFLAEGQGPKLANLLEKAFPGWTVSHDPQELIDLTLNPWDIPSRAVLTRVGRLFRDGAIWRRVKDWNRGFRARYRFSAAAVAIRFFGQLSHEQRRQLRRITLIEDAYAVCSPSTHAMGLIEFCKDNPTLKIERHLKLCRRAPAALSPYRVAYEYASISRIDPMSNVGEEQLFFENALSGISTWLEEAVSLQDARMPRHSFTLCLDGEPDKAFFSDIFQNILLRNDALMQASQTLYEMRPHQFRGEPPFRDRRRDRLSKALKYFTDQHSTAGSTNGDPLIRSNFHPGQPLDVEQLVNERLDWNERDWHMKHCGNTFQLKEYPSTFGRWYGNLMSYYEHKDQVQP